MRTKRYTNDYIFYIELNIFFDIVGALMI